MTDDAARGAPGAAVARVQHALNNALAALMAEAQLLELEELTAPQQEAVARMVELCRLMAGLVRELGGVQRPPSTPSPDE